MTFVDKGAMAMVFCPYTAKQWPINRTNEEHILPEALGGRRPFVLRVHASTNCNLGSSVDAKFLDQKYIKAFRAWFGLRGQSNREPRARFQRVVKITGSPNIESVKVETIVSKGKVEFRVPFQVFEPTTGKQYFT